MLITTTVQIKKNDSYRQTYSTDGHNLAGW